MKLVKCLLATFMIGAMLVPPLHADDEDFGDLFYKQLKKPGEVANSATKEASWQALTWDASRALMLEWAGKQRLTSEIQRKFNVLWDQPGKDSYEMLDRVAESLALANADARELKDFCDRPLTSVHLPEFAWLSDEKVDSLLRNNMRVYYGRYLIQNNLYDEALVTLADLMTNDILDPGALMFNRCVAYFQLVSPTESKGIAASIVRQEAALPRRYGELARLMDTDMNGVAPQTLNRIARQMEDIRRRLDKGRAGKKVREEENDVVAQLDAMILAIESAKGQMAPGGGGNPGGSGAGAPSAPQGITPGSQGAGNSAAASGKGAGDLDLKDIRKGGEWGSLDPKKRDEALQQIGREFPSYYRDAIEQFFRRVANDEGGAKGRE